MTLQRPWGPRKAFAFWGEGEQRSERGFRVYTETIDTEFVTTRARQRCGEIPGQELFRVKWQKENSAEHFKALNSHLYIEQVCSFPCVHTYTCTHVRREIA